MQALGWHEPGLEERPLVGPAHGRGDGAPIPLASERRAAAADLLGREGTEPVGCGRDVGNVVVGVPGSDPEPRHTDGWRPQDTHTSQSVGISAIPVTVIAGCRSPSSPIRSTWPTTRDWVTPSAPSACGPCTMGSIALGSVTSWSPWRRGRPPWRRSSSSTTGPMSRLSSGSAAAGEGGSTPTPGPGPPHGTPRCSPPVPGPASSAASTPASSRPRSARCARRATTPYRAAPWASASSTTSPWRRRSWRAGVSASSWSTTTPTTATAPRRRSTTIPGSPTSPSTSIRCIQAPGRCSRPGRARGRAPRPTCRCLPAPPATSSGPPWPTSWCRWPRTCARRGSWFRLASTRTGATRSPTSR